MRKSQNKAISKTLFILSKLRTEILRPYGMK